MVRHSPRGVFPERDRGDAARSFVAAVLAVAFAMLVFASSAGASAGTFQRAWGKNVNGGGVFEVCTVPPNCLAGATGGLGGEMNFPRGVAMDSAGNIYVADSGNHRIQKFSSSGTWERAWGQNVIQSGHAGDLGNVFEICTVAADCQAGAAGGGGTTGGLGGEMNQPFDVAVDSADNVYVADLVNNRIQKFNSSGTWERAWGRNVNGGGVFGVCTVASSCSRGTAGGLGGEMNFPVGLDTDSSGNVYVADEFNNRVQKFSSLGSWDRAWGKDVIQSGHTGDLGTVFEVCTVAADCQAGVTGGLGGEMSSPGGPAIDSGGNVLVPDSSNNRIQKFSPSGTWDRAWGKDVIQTGHTGDLGAVFEICTVAADCQAGTTGSRGGEMSFPADAATDSGDNLYVADQVNHRIQRFSSSGTWQRAWGRNVNGGNGVFGICTVASSCSIGVLPAPRGGEMSAPSGVATGTGGDVYVGDAGNHRIQLFDTTKATISTLATSTTTVGGSISDQATLSGGNSPTGTITFTAYGPNDPTCANTAAYTSSAVAVSGNGNYNNTPTFTPGTAGTYRWRASYSGDVNNAAVSTPCNDTNETSLVKTLPAVTTSATANAAIGASISDQATLSGGNSPTGDITFRAYGPNDANCFNAPAYTSSAVPVSGNGNYDNDPTFTPASAGTYRWTAFYSGDANNAAVVTPCNAANETSVVAQATPTITTQATANVAFGASISDRATLGGGSSPGGTITFRAYAPGDATCANTPAYTSSAVSVSGAGNYDNTPAFTPTAAGTYRWRASYSGDTNNAAVSTACNDANETSVVAQATLTITSQATNAAIGGSISDQATLSGGSSPGGTITFTAYGPGDATCALAPAYTSDPVAVSGTGSYESSPAFTPATAGTYRWRASYSGDTNNAAIATACNDTNETSVVAKATPTLSTQATSSVTLGEPIGDQATLAGGQSPTGTITFTAYGPEDAGCANTPAYTSDPLPVLGAGTYANSPAFTPATAGTYRWRASYSGDANNDPVAGSCNAVNETSVVNAIPAPLPVPTTDQSATVTGQRAAALKKCKKKKSAARRKCKKRAKRLPV